MTTSLDRKKAFLNWIDQVNSMKDLATIPNLIDAVYSAVDPDECAEYSEELSEASITVKVKGVKFEGRAARLENLRKGQSVKLSRDNGNANDLNCIAVSNSQNESLGNLPRELVSVLSPLLDSGEALITGGKVAVITPPSKLKDKRKSPVLCVSFKVKLNAESPKREVKCIVCQIGGDQTRCWAQTIRVLYCSMPLEDAKLIFELYNRQMNEYSGKVTETYYAGLDNLAQEIVDARNKMISEADTSIDRTLKQDAVLEKDGKRYENIKKYIPEGESFVPWIRDAFESCIVDEQTYYWLDETHVSKAEWDACYEYYHWYNVMELFEGNKLPVDLSDEDVVSVFGTKKFVAFADLSYGC